MSLRHDGKTVRARVLFVLEMMVVGATTTAEARAEGNSFTWAWETPRVGGVEHRFG